jgi:hypothetical protein
MTGPPGKRPRRRARKPDPARPPVDPHIPPVDPHIPPVDPNRPPIDPHRPPFPPIDPNLPPIHIVGRSTGASSVASQIVVQRALSQLDERTREEVAKSLGDLLPGTSVQPGTITGEHPVAQADLVTLIRGAAVNAAGLDPAKTPQPPPPVLWDSRGNRLLVNIAEVEARTDDGLIEIVIPVSCDQTGDSKATVTFVTGTADRPTGGIMTTEDHPRGDPVVVESWHEELIAFAWRAVLEATSAVAKVGGTDDAGRVLITNTVYASAGGLSVVPMARHTFFGTELT